MPALERALRAHAAPGGATVLATHDVELAARSATRAVVLGDGDVVASGPARDVLAGSLFAPQVLRVLPPFLTVDEVARALSGMTADTVTPRIGRRRVEPGPVAVYVLTTVLGAAAFLYPFWIPGRALPSTAHSGDAPLVAALVGALVVATISLEVRRGTMNGATVAILGVLSAFAGLGRLLDLPGNNAGMLFLVVLGGAAFGARFGLLLGMCTMAVSAFITGGIGPWLPFQMLALGWMGAGAGLVAGATRTLRSARRGRACSPGTRWAWGFLYGAIMNLWFWPFQRGGALSWYPGLGLADTLDRYWSFYVATSLGWDAADRARERGCWCSFWAFRVLRSLRRFAHRLDPVVELVGYRRFVEPRLGLIPTSGADRAGSVGSIFT